jgi:Polysaccharide lyase
MVLAVGLASQFACGAAGDSEAPAQPRAREGRILFHEGFESGGFSRWHVQSLPARISTVSAPAFHGTRAARFEVRAGDVEPDTGHQRSEIGGPEFRQGKDLYIRDAIRVASGETFSGPWQIVQQLHEEAGWHGSPGVAVFLTASPSLRIGRGDGDRTYWRSGELRNNRWYDLVYRVRLSQNPRVGFIQVWLNGVRQTLENGKARMSGQTIQTRVTELRVGIYRSRYSSGTSIVHHDDIVVGTSWAAVHRR